MSDCKGFIDLLLAGLDEPLPAADQARLDGHLAECPPCMAAMREHVVLRSLLQDLQRSTSDPAPPLPEELVGRLTVAMRAAHRAASTPGLDGTARTG